jgi:erythritol/L-threitol dehydrogenase
MNIQTDPETLAEAIPDTMKAVVCHGPRDYRLEQVPVPKPGPGEVLVKVILAGVCASDGKCYDGAPKIWGSNDGQGRYIEPPITVGHEFVAQVVQFGEGAEGRDGLKVGDHVCSEQIVPCGECLYCKEGLYWLCEPHDIYGFHQRTPGSWAEYMVFPRKALNYKLPEGMDPEHGVFVEPLGCAVHTINRAELRFNDTVVIAGCGSLGLGMVAAARMKNPKRIIALDLHPARLELARKCGADMTINPRDEDTVAKVKELTGGYGCDVYVEATGAPRAVTQGLDMIRKRGRFIEFSVFREAVTADWSIIGDTKELDIKGVHLSPYAYDTAIRMIAEGRLPMDEIITHKLPLEQFEEGIKMVIDGSASLKVTLRP